MSDDSDRIKYMDRIAHEILMRGCSLFVGRCRLVNRYQNDTYGTWYFNISTDSLVLDSHTIVPIRAHISVLYQYNVSPPGPEQESAVRALESVACAVACDHLIEPKSCQWLPDNTGKIQKHRIVLNILPLSAFAECLQNLRQSLVATIGDAQSFSDHLHYFHLSLDGPSTQVELEGLKSIVALSNVHSFASNVVPLSAQQSAIDNESDTDSSTATLLPEQLAQQKGTALQLMPPHVASQCDKHVWFPVGCNISLLPPRLWETVGDVRPPPARAQRICSCCIDLPCLVPHCWHLAMLSCQRHVPALYRCERCHLHTFFHPRCYIVSF